MEKNLVTQMTILVVAVILVVALGAAFWRASFRSGGQPTDHQHNHSSLEFIISKTAWS